jgi:gliding motility-associated-like protein
MKKIVLLLFFISQFYHVFADTFIVTTNADSGPRSLREAITLANANGPAVADIINFNIADVSEAGRTITPQTELPQLTSNTTIDGSTQPGANLGYSTAKITLYLDHEPLSDFNFIYIPYQGNVKIYGLCFRYFNALVVNSAYVCAIELRNSSDIVIGAPGKGNLFWDVPASIVNKFGTNAVNEHNVTIQSNVFGLTSDNNYGRGTNTISLQADNITLGGPTAAEGNLFFGVFIDAWPPPISQFNFFIKMQNNRFNYDPVRNSYYTGQSRIWIAGWYRGDKSNTTKTIIKDNFILLPGGTGLALIGLNHAVVVTGNKIGTDLTGTYCPTQASGLHIENSLNVRIGGYTTAEQNSIANLVFNAESGVHLIQNDLNDIHVYQIPGQPPAHFIKITSYDKGLITGKANPNSKIQLYTTACPVECVARKYLATVFSDAAGNWKFPYTVDMPNIVATATPSDSVTSEFTKPVVDQSKYKKQNPTCGRSNGSITGIVVEQGTHIAWINRLNLQVVSTDTNLVNMPTGSYMLTVSNAANGCKWSATFNLDDQSPPASIPPTIQDANCGQNDGSISVPNYNGFLSYTWLNANNDSIGNGDLLNLVFPGTYTLQASLPYDKTCSKTYGPFVVNNLSGPTLKTLATITTACSQANGSVTGISATNVTGTPFLQWIDAQDRPVGNSYDLQHIPAGKYRLKFKDASTCDTIFTPWYTVNQAPMPAFDYTRAAIQNDQCELHQGAVSNIQVTNLVGPTNYTWYNENNAVVSTSPNLQQVGAGTYTLSVVDGGICTVSSQPFTLINQDVVLPLHAYDNVTIPINTNAVLTIKNPSAGSYKLYADAGATVLLQENTNGNFTITKVKNDTIVYVQHSAGSCSSQPVPVKITAVDQSFFTIPNAFTPNGDGKNDRLTIRVKGRIELNYFRVYNRWGQLVFESRRVNDGWDGFFKGKLQTIGTYVWVAAGKDLLGNIIKEKGSFVLIH